jgi:hypothetical protein
MDLDFSIGQTPAKLTRGWFLGGMKLVTPDRSIWLQHPLNLTTHFDIRLTRSWQCSINGHKVRVEKTRPLLMAGLRDQNYRVFVDGTLAASANGK